MCTALFLTVLINSAHCLNFVTLKIKHVYTWRYICYFVNNWMLWSHRELVGSASSWPKRLFLFMSGCREFEFRYHIFVWEEVDLYVIKLLDNFGFLGLI